VRISAVPTLWLQGLHRGYKYGILMVAAWTPVAFPRHPIIIAVVLAMASALFFLATRSERKPAGDAAVSAK
jgi:hypothetical protein